MSFHQTRPATSGYLPTLDGWRAIAILGVMVAHGTASLLGVDGAFANERLYALSRYGAMGVDVFFGISGFLICSRLIEEHRARGRINLTGFYIRRFFRILPPYFALLAALALLSGVFAVSSGELLSSVFFLRNYYAPAAESGWYTGHLWSLAVEEHFYLLWPGLLVLWGVRRARWGCAALSLLIAVWRVAEFRLQIGETLIPGLGFYTRTDIRLDALLWGCWFALMLSDPQTRERLARLMSGQVWLVTLGALVAVVAAQPPLAMLWQSLLIPVLVIGTVLRPAGVVGRFLELSGLRWIGRMSYSLYLWQQLWLVGDGTASTLPFGLQTPPLNVVLVFACAAISYYGIERPMIKAGHRLAAPVTAGRR